jgi:hypothetical protein
MEKVGTSAAKLYIPDEDVDLLVTALEHYYSYTVAKKAEDSRYRDLADRLKRKPTEREPATQPGKPAKRRA